jgi:hypothetical protein
MQASSFEMLAAAGWHDDAMEWNRPSFVSSCHKTLPLGMTRNLSFSYKKSSTINDKKCLLPPDGTMQLNWI